jgi:type IV pilus assembly protein PilQ
VTSETTPPAPVLKAEPATAGGERFSLQIQDAEIAQVLDMLGQLSGLNILVGKEVKGKVTANLQDVNIDEALDAILRTHGFVFERKDRFIFVLTAAEHAARQQLTRKIVTKVYRPHYISVKDLQALVTPLITPTIGKIAVTNPPEVGIATDAENAGGDRLTQRDALLVQDYPEIIQEIDGVVAEMDVPPMQVVIEAMILSVKLSDSLAFGINFALLNDSGNNLVVSGNGATLNGGSGFPGTGTGSIVPPAAEFLANTAGLKYGFIRGDISLFLNALERIADTNLIASPQLRVLNKQRAELLIGDKLSYKTLAFNGTQTVENVNFLESGTRLLLRPFIAPDGLIRMEIHPERSSAVLNEQTGLPNQSTTEVTTNIMVRDGTTVVIGGLIEEQVFESFDRVPLLGALPVVGHAFRNKSERVDRTELIVLITPRIVFEPEEAIAGEVIRDQSERRAEHFRANLSHVNRGNLTRLHYERATYYFDRGELTRAQHHIQQALRQSKNDLPSLQLRDRIEAALHERKRGWLKFPFAGAPITAAKSPSPEKSARDTADAGPEFLPPEPRSVALEKAK